MTREQPDDELVRDLARVMVVEAAPDELPVFPALADAYFADPARALRAPRRRDSRGDPLEFGAAEVVVLVTPVAIAVASGVVQDLAAELARNAATRVTQAVRRLLRLADGERAQPGEVGLALTGERCAEIRANVFDTAVAYGLSQDEAGLLADAVVGRLARGDDADGCG